MRATTCTHNGRRGSRHAYGKLCANTQYLTNLLHISCSNEIRCLCTGTAQWNNATTVRRILPCTRMAAPTSQLCASPRASPPFCLLQSRCTRFTQHLSLQHAGKPLVTQCKKCPHALMITSRQMRPMMVTSARELLDSARMSSKNLAFSIMGPSLRLMASKRRSIS